jgi:hypothetical protein
MLKSLKESDCNSSNVVLSGRYKRSKLSIDDESSHPINGSNTNNKNERKRNINMLNDEDKKVEVCGDVEGGSDDDGEVHMKRIKVDGQEDNNKSKMYQVSTRVGKNLYCVSIPPFSILIKDILPRFSFRFFFLPPYI